MKLLALLPVLILAGCATTGQIDPIERAWPVESMDECPDLAELGDSTKEELVRWIAKTAPQYAGCSAGKKALIEWIKRGRK